jgi:hypothetical protein
MNANEFSVDRVDAMHNIASVTPAANEKDQKRKKGHQQSHDTAKNAETATDQAQADNLNVSPEDHLLDFEA